MTRVKVMVKIGSDQDNAKTLVLKYFDWYESSIWSATQLISFGARSALAFIVMPRSKMEYPKVKFEINGTSYIST
jgi:hypothetical protein